MRRLLLTCLLCLAVAVPASASLVLEGERPSVRERAIVLPAPTEATTTSSRPRVIEPPTPTTTASADHLRFSLDWVEGRLEPGQCWRRKGGNASMDDFNKVPCECPWILGRPFWGDAPRYKDGRLNWLFYFPVDVANADGKTFYVGKGDYLRAWTATKPVSPPFGKIWDNGFDWTSPRPFRSQYDRLIIHNMSSQASVWADTGKDHCWIDLPDFSPEDIICPADWQPPPYTLVRDRYQSWPCSWQT